MATAGDDLDLLLSIGEERVLETPPSSPSHLPFGDGLPKTSRSANMSVFRDAVKDYLDPVPASTSTNAMPPKSNKPKRSGEVAVEKYSGLRIKNQLISSIELDNRLSEIRFVRLPTIKNLLAGDTLSGCWVTVGVLTEKGVSRLTSAGKSYCIWKMGCLDETNVSVFLFNGAYSENCKEEVGSVFALFNSAVRKDSSGKGFSLSVYAADNILKIGTSADYGFCKGKRKDGVTCTMMINKRLGASCKYHSTKTSQRYSSVRAELKGGNFKMSWKPQSEGIYMVDPLADRSNLKKPQRVKVLSVDGLRKALSKAETVTSNSHSQGIRFLSEVTANMEPKIASKSSANPQAKNSLGKRPSSASQLASNIVIGRKHAELKRKKTNPASEKMIELDIVSSDEEG